jgi:hypothetical protein
MRIYGATGGIPFYLRFFDPDKSFYENVEHALFSKEAVLYAEGDFLLREELREPATYMNILYSISKVQQGRRNCCRSIFRNQGPILLSGHSYETWLCEERTSSGREVVYP